MTARRALQSLIAYGMKSDVKVIHVESRIQGYEAKPLRDYLVVFFIKSDTTLSYSATSM
jgi:hypothetical protein